MEDLKPIYKRINGLWVRKTAYQKQNGEWVKISNVDYTLTYTLINNDTEYEVSGYTGTPVNVTIPETYNGKPVTSIKQKAFYICKSLTSIEISDNVTSIGRDAFYGCSSLESMTLPFVGGSKTATTASDSTLFGYIFGTSSYTGGTATYQNYAYYSTECYYIPTSLKSVTITGGNILYGAFSSCSSLTSITILDSVTSISDYAFAGCSLLESITIGSGVTSIGESAFSSCYKLTSIEIPNSVTSIGIRAFRNCTSLTNITFGENSLLTSIGSYAFNYCTSLTSIVIPNSVTSIDAYAFECTSLTSVVIPESVTNIGYRAFKDCDNLTIYCEASSQPEGWDSDWNYSNCPVVWGDDTGHGGSAD